LKAARWRGAKRKREGVPGGHVCMEEGEGRTGGPSVVAGGRQWPPAVGCGWHHATRTEEPWGALTGGPRPQCWAAAPADRQA
jgi:hypothetical protein